MEASCARPHFLRAFFGLVNERQTVKIEDYSIETAAYCGNVSTMSGSFRLQSGHCFRHYLVLYGQGRQRAGSAGGARHCRDVRQNPSLASPVKSVPTLRAPKKRGRNPNPLFGSTFHNLASSPVFNVQIRNKTAEKKNL